jgi:hypothetical protein
MASAKSGDVERNRGVELQQKKLYSREQITDARLEATKLENERRKQAQVVARLERELASGKNASTVTGRLDDGMAVELIAENDTAARVFETLQQGKRYKVQGVGIVADGVLKLAMKTAAPADAAAIPVAPAPAPAPRRAAAPTPPPRDAAP